MLSALPGSCRECSGGILGGQCVEGAQGRLQFSGGRLCVGVQARGVEEQELQQVHFVLELGDQRLPQHLDQAAAEGLDLLLHVHDGDVVALLGLGLNPFDDQVFAIDHRTP